MTLRQIFLRHLEAEKSVISEFSGDFRGDTMKLEDTLIPHMNKHLQRPLKRSEWLEDYERENWGV